MPFQEASGFRPAVFFDRDGTLNHLVARPGFSIEGEPITHTAPFTPHEFQLLDQAADTVREIRQRGYLAIVVTNQPDVAHGFIPPETYRAIVDTFRSQVEVDDFFACMHRPKDGCACRKPSPEMLLRAADRHRIDLSRSFMVGDMETDMRAGHAAGTQTILITPHAHMESIARHRVTHVREILQLI